MTGTTLQTPHWLLSGKGRRSCLSVRRQNTHISAFKYELNTSNWCPLSIGIQKPNAVDFSWKQLQKWTLTTYISPVSHRLVQQTSTKQQEKKKPQKNVYFPGEADITWIFAAWAIKTACCDLMSQALLINQLFVCSLTHLLGFWERVRPWV